MANHCVEIGCIRCGRYECCRCSDGDGPSEERAKQFKEMLLGRMKPKKPDPTEEELLKFATLSTGDKCCGLTMIYV